MKKIKAVMAGIILGILLVPIGVCASEQTGSLSIYYRTVNEDEKEQEWEGVPFEVYYVGRPEAGRLEFQESFADSGISLSDNSSSARHEQAEKLYQYAKKEKIYAIQGKTNRNGRITFADLKIGIYLVAQSEHMTDTVTGAGWYSSPFLVSIPTWIGDKMVYQVTSEPKTEYVPVQTPVEPKPEEKPEPPKKPDNVKTGDENNLAGYLLMVTGSVGIFVFVMGKTRQKKKEENR